MMKYILGFFKNLLNPAISIFSLVDDKSNISRKSRVYRGVHLFSSDIDSYSYIGINSELICTDIGKFCSIADNCLIGLPAHSLKNISTSPIFTTHRNATGSSWTIHNTFNEYKRVSIGNDVWIGSKAMIMGGVTIGNGAVIGAGAIVTKNIPEYTIAVGVPAKVIKDRFDKIIVDELIELKWWNMSDDRLMKCIELFQIENFSLEDLRKVKCQI